MEWGDTKDAIRADLIARGLKEPRIRLAALDRVEKCLIECFPFFPNNPKGLLDVGKHTVEEELARSKANGKLNGAEKSVLKEIFVRLDGDSPNHADIGIDRRESFAVHSEAMPSQKAGHARLNVKRGLPPIIEGNSRILILGTVPGDESLRLQQYYAHGGNQFWRILAEVYGEAVGADYSQRIEFLHRRGLALWDVLQSAERAGSSDSSIRSEVVNDFAGLFATYRGLRAIVFNGKKARNLFWQGVEKSQSEAASLPQHALPPTSPTPGQYVLPFEKKVICWALLKTL